MVCLCLVGNKAKRRSATVGFTRTHGMQSHSAMERKVVNMLLMIFMTHVKSP